MIALKDSDICSQLILAHNFLTQVDKQMRMVHHTMRQEEVQKACEQLLNIGITATMMSQILAGKEVR